MTSSLAESLKSKIEHEILMFNFKPGDRLDEVRLADRYGSSRTPVREALRLLAAEGLVQIRPHRGAIVAGLSVTELIEMFEMMAIYEGVCALLAARHATPKDIAIMYEAHEECRKHADADDYESYCVANVRFHERIYFASRNSHLIKQTIGTRNRIAAYRRFQLRRHNRLKESFSEHDDVLEAIKKGDGEAADRLMYEHISVQTARTASLITNLPPGYFAETNSGRDVFEKDIDDDRYPFPHAALGFE
jgi:DNA-binding GntR family transcriptional regulator